MNQIQPSNQCGKNAETPIAFYKSLQMYANVTEHVLPHWFRAAFSVHAHKANLKHPPIRSGMDGDLHPCHRRWWVHTSAASTGHELLLSFPLGEAKLGGQASNTLPLRLELLHAMKATASAADILQWKTSAGPPQHTSDLASACCTLCNCKTVVTFGEEKDLKPTLLESAMFPPFDDFY